MSGKQKVAILKSRLYKGGVAQVLGFMIQNLNQKGIIPDILTLRSDLTPFDFKKLYNLEIQFRIRKIGPDLKMPYEWHFLYFNLLTRGYASQYNLFINSNNTSFLAPRKIKTITYVHFPRKYRVLSENKSIHFPEKKDKSFFDIRMDPFLLASFLYKFDKRYGKNEILIANSEFTASKMRESYSEQREIKVIYPPVSAITTEKKVKKMQVVTLGRISDEKRQLEQIEIASQLPEIPFYILGFSSLDGYYKKCQEEILRRNLSNVHLLPNLEHERIQNILSESAIFLHNVRNEPFGIGIVQAALQNCIPVIHGSGGAIEIVNNENMYFNSVEEAVSIISEIEKGDVRYVFTFKYSTQIFDENLNEIFKSIIINNNGV